MAGRLAGAFGPPAASNPSLADFRLCRAGPAPDSSGSGLAARIGPPAGWMATVVERFGSLPFAGPLDWLVEESFLGIGGLVDGTPSPAPIGPVVPGFSP